MLYTKKIKIAAAILAGGKAKRFGGIIKGNLEITQNRTIIDNLITAIKKANISQIAINANNPNNYKKYKLKIFSDNFKNSGPISGIESGLCHYREDHHAVLFLPCDLPNITFNEINILKDAYYKNPNLVYAETKKGIQPLCAIINCNLLNSIKKILLQGEKKIEPIWQALGGAKVFFDNTDAFLNINSYNDFISFKSTIKTPMNKNTAIKFVNHFWGSSVMPGLSEFIRIPAKSPAYDKNWEKNGNLTAAANFLCEWCKSQNIPGLKCQVLQHKHKSPFVFIDIPGSTKTNESILFYAHLDKMPESEGWQNNLGPWKPVIKNDRLYGRGSVDDGYAIFSLIAAIKLLEIQKIPYSRITVIIEAAEESGSTDLPFYLDILQSKLGKPSLITCLDVGCGDYKRLWCTSALRGIIEGTLRVELLSESVHSGIISGIIPSSFRVMRLLLDRIENEKTGEIILKSCHIKIPRYVKKQAKELAKFLGKSIYEEFPLLKNTKPVSHKLDELLLNRSWKPALCVIGADGLPQIKDAGTVMRPYTSVLLSLRLPPLVDPEKVIAELTTKVTTNTPYGAKVSFETTPSMTGWCAPKNSRWLDEAIYSSSNAYFNKAPMFSSEGGSIGVMPLLQEKFPKAQFFLTGAAGPNSNEHGPNESLHIPTARKIICCLAEVIAAHTSSRK